MSCGRPAASPRSRLLLPLLSAAHPGQSLTQCPQTPGAIQPSLGVPWVQLEPGLPPALRAPSSHDLHLPAPWPGTQGLGSRGAPGTAAHWHPPRRDPVTGPVHHPLSTLTPEAPPGTARSVRCVLGAWGPAAGSRRASLGAHAPLPGPPSPWSLAGQLPPWASSEPPHRLPPAWTVPSLGQLSSPPTACPCGLHHALPDVPALSSHHLHPHPVLQPRPLGRGGGPTVRLSRWPCLCSHAATTGGPLPSGGPPAPRPLPGAHWRLQDSPVVVSGRGGPRGWVWRAPLAS